MIGDMVGDSVYCFLQTAQILRVLPIMKNFFSFALYPSTFAFLPGCDA